MAAPMLSYICPSIKACNLRCLRYLHSSLILNNDVYNSRYMKKLLNKGNRKKDKWFAPTNVQTSLPTVASHEKTKSRRQYSDRMVRRSQWVSVILFNEISRLVSLGALNIHFTVLKVEVVPDMSAVKVHWEASGRKDEDDKMQEELNMQAATLGHELIQSQVLGRVPAIVFMKDLSTYKQRELDELFKRLDVGPPSEDELSDFSDGESENDDWSKHSDERQQMKNYLSRKIEKSFDKEETHTKLMKLMEKSQIQNDMDSSQVCIESDVSSAGTSGIEGRRVKDNSVKADEGVESCESFRQDLYGLQHDVLMQKVVDSKMSSSFRPVVVSDTSESNTNQEQLKWETKKVIRKKEEKPKSGKKLKVKLMQQYIEEEKYLKNIEERFEQGNLDNDSREDHIDNDIDQDDFDIEAFDFTKQRN